MPKWFNTNEIPFDQMWKDDKIWFPYFLSKKLFKGYFLFKDDQETIVDYRIDQVESFRDLARFSEE
jgi:8-oxo-dGTP diphosphatase/2-hydroxy-dATP diphosphatase